MKTSKSEGSLLGRESERRYTRLDSRASVSATTGFLRAGCPNPHDTNPGDSVDCRYQESIFGAYNMDMDGSVLSSEL